LPCLALATPAAVSAFNGEEVAHLRPFPASIAAVRWEGVSN